MVQVGHGEESFPDSNILSVLVDESTELTALVLVNGAALLPGERRRRSGRTARPRQLIGLLACGFDIVAGPVIGMTTVCRLVMGARFQGTDAGFASAIVGGEPGRREEGADLPLIEEPGGVVGDEGGAVVGLQNQRGTVDSEETSECINGDTSGLGFDGKPEELTAGAQVADGKEVRILSING
jgi:hypothetical protein